MSAEVAFWILVCLSWAATLYGWVIDDAWPFGCGLALGAIALGLLLSGAT